MKERWAYLASRLPELQGYIDATALALDAVQKRNFQRWPILDTYVWPNAAVTGSYAGEVGYLKDWLHQRAAWMDSQLRPDTPPPRITAVDERLRAAETAAPPLNQARWRVAFHSVALRP